MEALGGDSPWMESGQFDLHRFLIQLWASGFLTTAEVLKAAGQEPQTFWRGAKLDAQWERGSRADREAAFATAMRFQNTLDEAEYAEDGPDPRILVLHATTRLKALLLATAIDATYKTDYLERIVSDPAQFGVEELGE